MTRATGIILCYKVPGLYVKWQKGIGGENKEQMQWIEKIQNFNPVRSVHHYKCEWSKDIK